MNKSKVLSIKGEVKLTRQIANGKKEVGVCWEFGLVNSMIQTICKKTEPKL